MCWKGRIEEMEKERKRVGCSGGSRGKRVGVKVKKSKEKKMGVL